MEAIILFILLPVLSSAQDISYEVFSFEAINRDTTYYYHSSPVGCGGELYVTIKSDSISGATNVRTEIQYACDLDGIWVTHPKGVLDSNGSKPQGLFFSDRHFGADKLRIRSISIGTQRTMIEISCVYQPNECDQ